MPGPSLRSVLLLLLLAAKVASGQAPADVKPAEAKPNSETSDSSKRAPTITRTASRIPQSRTDNWGLLPPGEDPENHLFLPFAKHLVQDQARFWTYPVHARRGDAKYVLPFLAFTGALVASDSWMVKQVPDSPGQLKRSLDFSNYGLYSLIGGMGATYLWGEIRHDDHLTETGFLAGEAAIDSTAIAYALKGVSQRTRPLDGNGSSGFFRGGYSFPSEHSAIAWSAASVLAHEYPGTLTKLLAYGLATGISVSRVTSKQHFPSDVVIGSALGWYMGRQVYRAHHDPGLGGAGWGSNAPQASSSEGHSWWGRGSPSVPLDSWVYPALERLAALGYVQTEILGQRPWTRSECARLLEEASGLVSSEEDGGGEAAKIYKSLQDEFLPEQQKLDGNNNLGLRLDSLYTRVTNISGPPLTDSYNFGTTIINDYGRPFQRGTNVYSGGSAYGTAGPLSFYVQTEYQHAPSGPAEPVDAQQAIATQLHVPFAAAESFAEVNRPRIVEGYISLAVSDMQFSFGKQALTWGPTETGAFLWSTNAESVLMFRISNPHPFRLPSILRWLGPASSEFFVGQLEGHQFILDQAGNLIGPGGLRTQPFVHGQKLSFKPTSNLEFGFSRTVVFGGQGHPFTFANFWTSFTSVSSDYAEPHIDAGDRHSGFDISYRIPYLRKWLTWYTDSFCEDDVLSVSAPARCAWSPGIYVPQFPRLSKLDFRLEGAYTDVSGFPGATGISYTNGIYPSGYTNNGNILGNWVGREGRGLQLWTTYWFSPQCKVQAGYRHQNVDPDFLQGGHLNDFSLRADLTIRSGLSFSGTAQYEQWNFPLLASSSKSNVSLGMSLIYRPKWGFKH